MMDEIQHSETPGGVLPGLLVIATNRRQLKAAVKAIPKRRVSDDLREVLVEVYGLGQADVIINDMARGLVLR